MAAQTQETLGRLHTGDPHTIALDEWRYVLDADGAETGYLRRVQGRVAKAVVADLQYELRELLAEAEYANPGMDFAYAKEPEQERIPAYRRVACYAVTGGNEGHYVHVDVVLQDMTHVNLMLVKTFMGVEHAWKIAMRAAELLEA